MELCVGSNYLFKHSSYTQKIYNLLTKVVLTNHVSSSSTPLI